MSFSDLPAVNAGLNGLSAVLLTFGFYFIRRKNMIAHRNCMIAALVSSVIFLACYLTYHFTVRTVTRFHDPAWFRPYYLAILISHTILAATIGPMIIITAIRAFRERFDQHRKIARWTVELPGRTVDQAGPRVDLAH